MDDRPSFDALMVRARAMRAGGSASERELLDLLLAHQAALDGQYPQAMIAAQRLFERGHAADIRYRAAMLAASTAATTRDYATGLRYLSLGSAMEGQVASPGLALHGDSVATAVYNQAGQPRLALRHAERILARRPAARVACLGHENRVRALAELKRAREKDFTDAIAECERAGEPRLSGLARAGHARFLAETGARARAVEVAASALPAARAAGYPRLWGELHAMIAQSELHRGRHAAAAAAAREVLSVVGEHADWAPVRIAHQVLHADAERRGDPSAALAHFVAFHNAQRAHMDHVKAREHAFMSTRMDALESQQRARSLSQENAALALQQQVAVEQARTLRLSVVLLGLVIGGVAYWAWHYRSTHRMLRRQTQTDSLTGVATRMHFTAEAAMLIADCARRELPVAALLLDVDHFKQVNDLCGHAVGDWVLREVALACRETCPPEACVGRIGGEEFAVVVPGASMEQAMELAERLRQRIRAIDALSGGCHLAITASVGVADSTRSGHRFQPLLDDADAAMYAAKRSGRDRVAPTRTLDPCT